MTYRVFPILSAIALFCAEIAAQPILQVHTPPQVGVSSFQEFQPIYIEAIDNALAGSGSMLVRVQSSLGGDVEWVTLNEIAYNLGTFAQTLPTIATYDENPPAVGDGVLEVTEIAGTPPQRDTVELQLWNCSSSPNCPVQALSVTGNRIRLTDSNGVDIIRALPNDVIGIEVSDFSLPPGSGFTIALTCGTDTENVLLNPVGYGNGRWYGSITIQNGAVVAGDGLVQAPAGPSTLTVSHPDPLGLSMATATLLIESEALDFLDRAGAATETQLLGGPIRVRANAPLANLDSNTLESLTLSVIVRDGLNGIHDTETMTLSEVGPDSSVFEGSLPSQHLALPVALDGIVQTDAYYQLADTIEISTGTRTATATMIPGKVEFVNIDGIPTSTVQAGVVTWIRVESDYANQNPAASEQITLMIVSESGDEESFTLTEVGLDSPIFQKSFSAVVSALIYSNGRMEAQIGHTLHTWYDVGDLQVVWNAEVVPHPNNQPPVAYDDVRTTFEDLVFLMPNLLNNDQDPEAYTLHMGSFTQPLHGTVTIDPGNSNWLVYTPTLNYFGTDSFTYTVADPHGNSDTATVTLTVQPVTDPPIAVNDNISLAEDTTFTFSARANDLDPDAEGISVYSYDRTSVRGGTISVAASPADFQYRPAYNFSGSDSFTYRIVGDGGYSTATVFITVTPVPDYPEPYDDMITTQEDVPITFDPRINDRDGDGDTFVVDSTDTLAAKINPDGTITYTPPWNLSGTRTFNYYLRDSTGRRSQWAGRVYVNVTAVNDPPYADDDFFSVTEDTLTTLPVRANDGDTELATVTIVSVTQTSHGVLTLNSPTSLSYRPDLNYNGPDSFSYVITDGNSTATANVTLNVTPVNDPPVGGADFANTNEDTLIDIDVLANDSDVEGTALSVYTYTQPLRGSVSKVTVNGRWHLRYTPAANTSGADSFTYVARDAGGANSASTPVSVTVNPVNDAPVARQDSATTLEDTPITINVLANDTDTEGDTLTVTSFSLNGGTNQGTLILNPDKTLTYVPSYNFNGSATISYQISDGTATASSTVSLTITPVLDLPIARDDVATTVEESSVDIPLLANDDPGEGPATVEYTFALVGGSASVNTLTGVATFHPNANFNGVGGFSYRIKDSNNAVSDGQVTITVSPVNDAPTAVNDSVSLDEDSSFTFAPLANDLDVDGDTLTLTSVSQGLHGSVTFDSTSITYVPEADFQGSDSLTYTLSDGNGGDATATISLTVTEVNDTPLALDDVLVVAEDAAATSIAVLANDTDLDGDSLAVTGVSSPQNGTASFTGGAVFYSPSAHFHGSDTFTYDLSDGRGGTASATVSITVNAVNDPPLAENDTFSVNEDGSAAFAVLGNDSDVDGDTLVITSVSQGLHGSVVFDSTSITYEPVANFQGSDSFTYSMSDGNGGNATATVSVTVTEVNDAPSAANDVLVVAEDAAATMLAVLANDSDPDGDSLVITGVSSPLNGTASFTASAVFYTPNANYNGPDSFTYNLSDGRGGTASATVSITVTAVNDAPVAVGDNLVLAEDTAATIDVRANDSDVETPAALSVIGVSPAAHGSLSLNGGLVTYTPVPGFFGPDSFSYTLSDPQGATSSATVMVTVTSVNDVPVAQNDSATTSESGSGVVLAVLDNDSDADGDSLTVTQVGAAQFGVATRNADNTISYVPAANFTGTDTFTYTVSDGNASSTATVSIVVTEALARVAVLGTHSVLVETGADVISGDVVVNAVGSAPFLGTSQLQLGSSTTVAAGWDVQGNQVGVLSGAVIAADLHRNTLSNSSGTLTGAQYLSLALPVFTTLPTLQTATPGATDVNVGTSGTRTLAPGIYRDLIVGRKGTVTFTGGVYVFRSISLNREVNLNFSAPSTVKVQQKMSTGVTTKIQPAVGGTATASTIVFHIAGINGTGGGLSETPKAVAIGTGNVVAANLYAPNGTLWLQSGSVATGTFFGKDVQIGPDVQVTLSSGW